MSGENTWLDERVITPEQAKAEFKHLEATNSGYAPSALQTSLLQQILSELQKHTLLMSATSGCTLMPSSNGKDFLLVKTTELTTQQLVQHIDPNFCIERVVVDNVPQYHLYDKRYPKTDDLVWAFFGVELGFGPVTYKEAFNAIESLKTQRSQQK